MINAQAIRDKVAQAIKDNFKDDNPKGTYASPYADSKGAVLQGTRAFDDPSIDPISCFDSLTRVLNILITNGEQLAPQESTDLFFRVTKLFQCTNERLRRMVYLVVKSIPASTHEVFIVTSSLTKDMNSGSDCHRANAIRVLSKILDPTVAVQIERYLKTAMVDRNPFVASSALCCGMSMLRTCPDVVKRWVAEVSESVNSRHPLVQYHALALLYGLKQFDRLALHKVVLGLTKKSDKSPYAECLLIRIASRALKESNGAEKEFAQYINGCLKHRSEMVVFEAARAVCRLAEEERGPTNEMSVFGIDLAAAVTVLQVFLTSLKSSVRYGAVRCFSRLAQVRPNIAARSSVDVEPLLSDSNRAIAALALMTLLKTGHESSVERLVKQIANLMGETTDSFRLEIVSAVKQLALQYPSKHKVLMTFIASQLREEGSYELKRDLVDALQECVLRIPQAQNAGLLHLCEFIEDCEYHTLCVKVLGFLAEVCPKVPRRSKYVRFIYNRLLLENAIIRAASMDALTKVALRCPELRKDVITLLESCENDNDDEVRDRSLLYRRALINAVRLHAEEPVDGETCETAMSLEVQRNDSVSTVAPSVASDVTLDELLDAVPAVALDPLYDTLKAYLDAVQNVEEDGSAHEGHMMPSLDVSALPTEEEYVRAKQQTSRGEAFPATAAQKRPSRPESTGVSAPASNTSTTAIESTRGSALGTTAEVSADETDDLRMAVASIVSPHNLGSLSHSSGKQPLTETEAEYSVAAITHVFDSHYLVVEFIIKNTLQEQILKKLTVAVSSSASLKVMGGTTIGELYYGVPGSVYVVLEKEVSSPIGVATGLLPCLMRFQLHEAGDEFGYEDEYALESLTISLGTFCFPRSLRMGTFKSLWEALGEENQAVGRMVLPQRSIKDATDTLLRDFNLAACEDSGVVEATKKNHSLFLSGYFNGKVQVLCRCVLVLDPEKGLLLRITARSESKEISQALASIYD